jgi:hypothetical protein
MFDSVYKITKPAKGCKENQSIREYFDLILNVLLVTFIHYDNLHNNIFSGDMVISNSGYAIYNHR